MALLKCVDCEQPISDRASKCPHCGAPKRAQHRKRSARSLALERLGFALIALGAVLMVAGAGSEGNVARVGGLFLLAGFIPFLIGRSLD